MYLGGAYELRHPEAASQHKIRYMDNKDVMPFVSTSLILDYIGINFDCEKAIGIEKVFALNVKNSDEFHIVQIYKGTIFHDKIDKSKIPSGIPILSLSNTELYELTTKEYKQKEELKPDANEIIKILQEFIVDTSKYSNFNIIEPLSKDIWMV